MPYISGYQLLTVHWTVTETTAETAQFGLKFAGSAASDQATVDACAAAVSTMWSSAGADIPAERRLAFLRLASVGTDGLYIPGTVAYDHVYAAPVAGGGALAAGWPLQVAHVVSLLTATPRGLAHAGRVYLPPIDETLLSTGQWTTAQANARSAVFATMLTSLNATIPGNASIMSKVGGGAVHPVTNVRCDTRPDVQRRRAAQQIGVLGSLSAVS